MSAQLALDSTGTLSSQQIEMPQTSPSRSDLIGNTGDAGSDWSQILKKTLLEWYSSPAPFKDEEFPPPSRVALWDAIVLARLLERQRQPAPTSIVPSVDGGVVLERRDRSYLFIIEVLNDGRIEEIVFKNGKISSRNVLREGRVQ